MSTLNTGCEKHLSTHGMNRFTSSLLNLQRPAGNSATASSSRTRSLWWKGGAAPSSLRPGWYRSMVGGL
ncbi:rCG56502, isoform CRA_c [Rattus norvegicus]|uniref:RCG56502, isoform CRA_c n=1 Tax=Rattus norvegicus TaxID=10116 RepID=A6IAS1_RAT|nr:rCG56502, isoform CRA_c [Rattus norvegicus]